MSYVGGKKITNICDKNGQDESSSLCEIRNYVAEKKLTNICDNYVNKIIIFSAEGRKILDFSNRLKRSKNRFLKNYEL